MAQFEIHNSEGTAIKLSAIDVIAATFWKKDVDTKYWAYPETEDENNQNAFTFNWYDFIGYHIANPQCKWTKGWDNIKCSLMILQLNNIALQVDPHAYLEANIQFLKPMFELIDHFASLELIPVRVD